MDFDSRYAYIGTPVGLSVYDKEKDCWLVLDFVISEKTTVMAEKFHYTSASNILSVLADTEWIWVGVGERQGIFKINLGINEVERGQKDRLNSGGNVNKIKCPLPSNHVISIKKDKEGNIWFATPHGIAQYDGENWEVIPVKTYYRESKLDATVTSIAIDNANRLWVGTSDFYYAYYDPIDGLNEEDVKGGIILFNGGNWQYFYAYNYNLEKEDSSHIKTPLLSNDVNCVAIDSHDIWIGTKDGVSIYNYESNAWRNYDENHSDVLSDIVSIAVTPDYVWTASLKGIAKFHKHELKWSISGEKELPFTSVRSIAYDPYDNSIWVVTYLYAYKDIYVYRYKNGEWFIYPTRRRVNMKDPDDLVQLGIFLDRRKVYSEAKIVFKEFLTKYPTHEKSGYVEKELLLLDQSGW
jgi:ligand-binding sensor domain-containing protein